MPPAGILIRLLNPQDAEAYLELRLKSLRLAPLASSSSFEEESQSDVASIRNRLERQVQTGCAFVGAFDAGRLIGLVCLHRERRTKNQHKAMMWGLFVEEEYRHRGIGRALLEKVIAICHASSALTQLRTTIASDLTFGLELYRSLGFVTFGLEEDSLRIDGKSYDVEYMALRLRQQPPDTPSKDTPRV